jgi:hypothetical protein
MDLGNGSLAIFSLSFGKSRSKLAFQFDCFEVKLKLILSGYVIAGGSPVGRDNKYDTSLPVTNSSKSRPENLGFTWMIIFPTPLKSGPNLSQ